MNRKLQNSELNRIDVEAFKASSKIPVSVILDDIRSLNNIGSVFRTCDAFRIKKVYLCGITAQPPHREIQKTALGATESVEWEYHDSAKDLVMELISQGSEVMALEQTIDSNSLESIELDAGQEYVLVFGNEVKGVSQNVIDNCCGVIEIPQFGTKHSLNISVSTGIVLWDFFKKLKGKLA